MLKMSFAIDGRRFFLTWSQADVLTKEIIANYLQDAGKIEYLKIVRETHNNGGQHFHAFVCYEKRIKKRRNIFTIDNYVCNVRRLSTAAQCRKRLNYITKEDKQPLERGTLPEDLQKLDKRGKAFFAIEHSNVECIESGHFSFSELRNIQYIRNMFMEEWPQFKPREVWWLFGATGTGKTRTAWSMLLRDFSLRDIWISSGDLKNFFNGYVGQHGVILDDLRPGSIKFDFLLRILDGYPVDVPVKGSYCIWRAEKIVITAPCKPNEMYVNKETGEEWDHLDQLLRRINHVKEIRNYVEEEVHWSDDENDIRNAIGY